MLFRELKKTCEVQSTYLRVVKPQLNVMNLYNKNYNCVMKNCCKIDEMNLFVQVTEDMPASKGQWFVLVIYWTILTGIVSWTSPWLFSQP